MTSPGSLRPARRPTVSVDVGGVLVGSAHPVVVQSMTNTDTADPDSTAIQVARLAHAGSRARARHRQHRAGCRGRPRDRCAGCGTTWVSTSRSSATSTTTATSSWSSSRRWPRRSPSTASTRATWAASTTMPTSGRSCAWRSSTTSRSASASTGAASTSSCSPSSWTPTRARRARDARDVMIEAMIESAMRSAELAETTGLRHDRIILSAKVSRVRDLVDVYRRLAAALRLPAPPGPHRGRHGHEGHRGLHRRSRHPAPRGHRGHHPSLAHAAAGRRPERGGPGRPAGAAVAWAALVRAPGVRLPRLRPHHEHLLPGDGGANHRPPQRHDARVARRATRAWRTCGLRSWAASSTVPASPSTRTSGSRCPAPSRHRWRPCSSTAGWTGRCAATGSSPSSSTSWRLRRPALRAGAGGPARLIRPVPGPGSAPAWRPTPRRSSDARRAGAGARRQAPSDGRRATASWARGLAWIEGPLGPGVYSRPTQRGRHRTWVTNPRFFVWIEPSQGPGAKQGGT